MEWNIVLAVIFGAVTVIGGVETSYQIYKLTVLDAVARGLKHPKTFLTDRGIECRAKQRKFGKWFLCLAKGHDACHALETVDKVVNPPQQ